MAHRKLITVSEWILVKKYLWTYIQFSQNSKARSHATTTLSLKDGLRELVVLFAAQKKYTAETQSNGLSVLVVIVHLVYIMALYFMPADFL